MIYKSWIVEDVPEDPLTGGDVHLNGIKAHLYDDYFSITWPNLKIGSLGAVAVTAHGFKDKSSIFTLWIWEFKQHNWISLDWMLLCI